MIKESLIADFEATTKPCLVSILVSRNEKDYASQELALMTDQERDFIHEKSLTNPYGTTVLRLQNHDGDVKNFHFTNDLDIFRKPSVLTPIFYLEEHFHIRRVLSPGRVKESTEEMRIHSERLDYPVTQSQYDRILQDVRDTRTRYYSLDFNNCVHFVTKAARKIGLDIPSLTIARPKYFALEIVRENQKSAQYPDRKIVTFLKHRHEVSNAKNK